MVFFMLLFAGVAIATLVTAVQKRRSDDENKKDVMPLLYIGVMACLIQFLDFTLESAETARWFASIYCATMYWLAFFVTAYMADFTRLYKEKKPVRLFFHILGVADTALMAVNIFVDGFVFSMMRVELMNGIRFHLVCEPTVLMWIHIGLCALLMCAPVISLFFKALKTHNTFYHRKYSIIFRLVVIAVAINIICMVMRSPIDFSILVYCIMVDLAEYFLSVYMPNKLRDQTTLLSVQQMNDIACIYDPDRKLVFKNESAHKAFTDIELDRIMDSVFRYTSMPENIYKEVVKYKTEIEVSLGKDQPETSPYGISFRRLKYNDELIGFYIMLHDRTEEVENFKKEHYRVTHDELTDLYNRSYFVEKARDFLLTNTDKNYYFVLSDIDNFKVYNEIYGMKQGDLVLKNEAELIQNLASRESVFGRLGGDEFAIIIREDYFSDELFTDCISKIREEFSDYRFKIGINAGVYKITDHNEPILSMYNKAMIAIDSIRDNYSSVLAHFTDEMFEDTVLSRFLVDELDGSLAADAFKMYLQPQVDAKTGKWIGAEALVRWVHPDRGIIPPGEFVPLFEKMGVISRVDEYIWEKAAAKLHEWNLAGHEDMYISVNISGDDFYHFDMYDKFTSIVERNCIAPAQLKLEITESFMVKDSERRKQMLERLRNYGFIVEIDDFGSGYSALNSLKDIPYDVIKVDMGFLRKSENKAQSNIILEMVIRLIKRLKKEIITEGVEHEEQVKMLQELGCDIFQGYYFSKPIPVEEFEQKAFNQ